MAQSSNTHDRYDLNPSGRGESVREDLSDIIYNISPTETPFTVNVGKEKSENTYSEWQLDELADPSLSNAHIDGDEFAGLGLTSSARVGNYHQISRKDLVVSRRANIVNKAGRRSEMAYQIAKKGKELRRDVEYRALFRAPAVVGSGSAAMQTAGVPCWIRSNISRGAGSPTNPTLSGTNSGYPNAIGTQGTARGFTESGMLAQSRAVYEAGGSANMVLFDTQIKASLSSFLFGSSSNRIATPYQDHGARAKSGVSVIGAVDVYTDDFHILDFVPTRFLPQYGSANTRKDVLVLDTDYWCLSYLDGFHTEDIAKVGDHRRRMLLVDWMVKCKNEEASAVIADVNPATAVAA